MKVAISASENRLTGMMDQRFGRAPFFLVVESETMDFEVIDNSGAASAGGAGVTSAQTVVDGGAEAVITGNVGPNAMSVLSVAGIAIYRGNAASVEENIAEFKRGMLKKIDNAVSSHFGIGSIGGRK